MKSTMANSFLTRILTATFIVYPKSKEIWVFTCPIKLPSKKKQIVSQMCLVIFAERSPEEKTLPYPPIFPVEPAGWEDKYYKRARNRARFSRTA